MASSRLKIAARLLLLLGLPVAVVAGLFGTGVYVGATHRHAVTSFERDWLSLDVEVPPAPPEPPAEATPATVETPAPSPEQPAPSQPAPTADLPAASPPPTQAAAPTPAPTPAPQPGAATPAPQPAPAAAVPAAAPLSGDLAKRAELPVTVRLKILVDPELIAAEPAWIDYAQRTVSHASQIYAAQFGITLDLVGVGRWMVATAGMDAGQLLSDVRERPREGADVLIGLTNRPLDGSVAGQSEQPVGSSAFNGAYAVVYATPRHPEPHLRTLLHELGHIFGAEDVTDPSHADYRAGSWMSYAPVTPGQAPWIDATNRQRILERKDKPFAPEGASRPPAPAREGN